jgi:hypothetical protein
MTQPKPLPTVSRDGYAILVSFVYPPIPDRRWDYSAVDYSTYDGGENQPIGHGPTEEAAIADLLEQLRERDDG